MADFLGDSLLKTLEIKDWDQLFGYLAWNIPSGRFYLLIDEFSYLVKSDKRILSVLQKYWDTAFASSNICILLCVSMLGLMSEMVLSYASPLYGRRSSSINRLFLTGIQGAKDIFFHSQCHHLWQHEAYGNRQLCSFHHNKVDYLGVANLSQTYTNRSIFHSLIVMQTPYIPQEKQ